MNEDVRTELDEMLIGRNVPLGRFETKARDYAVRVVESGEISAEDLAEQYTLYGLKLRAMGRESLEDELLEVVSLLVGWCSPSARIEGPK